MIMSRLLLRGMTIRAPVFCSDMDLQASAISLTSALSMDLSLMPISLLRNARPFLPILEPLPNRTRKCRISGWKMMMIASTPTSMNVPSIALIIFIFSASATVFKTNIEMIAVKMFIAAEPRIHLNTR